MVGWFNFRQRERGRDDKNKITKHRIHEGRWLEKLLANRSNVVNYLVKYIKKKKKRKQQKQLK